MTIELVSRRVCELTAQLADEFTSYPAIRNERAVTKRRIREHLRLMRANSFFMPNWGKVTCKEDGVVRRANGQHTSNLFAWLHRYPDIPDDAKQLCGFRGPSDVPTPPDVQVSVDSWEVDSQSELSTVFAYYDSAASVRSRNDVMAIHAGEHDEFAGVQGVLLSHLLNGVCFYAKNIKRTPDALLGHDSLTIPPANDRASLLAHDGVRKYMRWFLDLNDDLRVLQGSVPISAWVVLQYESMGPSEATAFFDRVLEEDEDQEGAGYDIMSLVRKQKSRKQRSLSDDKVIQRLRKFSEVIEV